MIGYSYLKGDTDVAGHIFSGMGNVSLAGFISYLTGKFETDSKIADHVYHLLKMFNILRENRNILEHSVPYQTSGGTYQEAITKSNARGERLNFGLPFEQLENILDDMISARNYARILSVSLYPYKEDGTEGGIDDFKPLARDTIGSSDKPPLPRKIDPLLPEEVLPDA